MSRGVPHGTKHCEYDWATGRNRCRRVARWQCGIIYVCQEHLKTLPVKDAASIKPFQQNNDHARLVLERDRLVIELQTSQSELRQTCGELSAVVSQNAAFRKRLFEAHFLTEQLKDKFLPESATSKNAELALRIQTILNTLKGA